MNILLELYLLISVITIIVVDVSPYSPINFIRFKEIREDDLTIGIIGDIVVFIIINFIIVLACFTPINIFILLITMSNYNKTK